MFQGFRLRWAARRYAARLPRQLSKSYGPKRVYTELQIRRAAEAAGLNSRYIALGFARYMTGPDFAGLMGPKLDYAAFRAMFIAYQRIPMDSGGAAPVTEERTP